jgi:capsular polysaccharide transport system permease protein
MSEPQRTALQVQRDVLYALVLREMQSRMGRSRVGFLWSLLEPAAHLVVPVILFGVVIQRTVPGQDYPVFLLYSFLSFLLFKNACLKTMSGVTTAGNVLSYRQVMLMDVFVARLVAGTLLECLLIAMVLTGLALFGYEVLPPRPVELLALVALAVLLGFGLGLVFAALVSFVPDLATVIRIAFVPLYFMTGVLFPVSRFPAPIVDKLAWNPVLHVVEMCRWAGLPHYEPIPQSDIVYPVALMLVALCMGLALYRLRVVNKVSA